MRLKPGVSGKGMLAIFFVALTVTAVWILAGCSKTHTADRSADMDSYHSRKAGGSPPARVTLARVPIHERRAAKSENSGLITPSV
jgi:hypothetical protein